MMTIGEFARMGQISPRMLRHYDELGLLRPDRVDPVTGYRFYGAGQLAELHRLLALRDVGFSLDQVATVLRDDPPLADFAQLLRLRRAQIEEQLSAEQARLRRVDAHLHALEKDRQRQLDRKTGRTWAMSIDVLVKKSEPLRLVQMPATVAGPGPEQLGPVFARILPEVLNRLAAAGVRPGIAAAYYEGPADDGTMIAHIGFDIGGQAVPDQSLAEGAVVSELPATRVASLIHSGPIETVGESYEALHAWIEESGYAVVAPPRELYREWHDDDPSANVTELQFPVAAGGA